MNKILGQGGMGTVYLVDDLKLPGKMWAVKQTIHQAGAMDADALVEEARVMMRLNHPHLPNIVDFFGPDETGCTYLVMDYIRGRTLEQLFVQGGNEIAYSIVLSYSIQLCRLFVYLHSQRPEPIIYRDLKPGNVMVDEQEQVRLIDFGIARGYKEGLEADTVQIGTIGFAAPEQFQRMQTDQRTDLYTLGALIYFLLSGGRFYYTLQRPLTELRGDLPERFSEAVDRLLRTRPEERFQSAGEVLQVLEGLPSIGSGGVDGGRMTAANTDRDAFPVMAAQSKLIVIGSLYPGAGSTFIGMSVARALNRLGVPNAYVENPTNPPDLYALLYGEKRAPREYDFYDRQIAGGDMNSGRERWVEGVTEWVPASPQQPVRAWNVESNLKLLQAVRSPYLIFDASTQWQDEHVREICRLADAIVVVTESSPAKMYRPAVQDLVQWLLELQSSGKELHLVANRDVPLRGKSQWLSSLFVHPVCCFPALEETKIIECLWRGKLIQDQDGFHDIIDGHLEPLLNAILSGITTMKRRGISRPGLLGKLMRRKNKHEYRKGIVKM